MTDDPAHKSQEFFGMFLKAKEFTEELLKEMPSPSWVRFETAPT